MKLNWNFLGGVGVQNKKPSVGGVWIFSGTTQCRTFACSPPPPFCLNNDTCIREVSMKESCPVRVDMNSGVVSAYYKEVST